MLTPHPLALRLAEHSCCVPYCPLTVYGGSWTEIEQYSSSLALEDNTRKKCLGPRRIKTEPQRWTQTDLLMQDLTSSNCNRVEVEWNEQGADIDPGRASLFTWARHALPSFSSAAVLFLVFKSLLPWLSSGMFDTRLAVPHSFYVGRWPFPQHIIATSGTPLIGGSWQGRYHDDGFDFWFLPFWMLQGIGGWHQSRWRHGSHQRCGEV